MVEIKQLAERIITGCIFDEDDFNTFQCCYGNDEKIKEHTTDCQALAVKCLKELLANVNSKDQALAEKESELKFIKAVCDDAQKKASECLERENFNLITIHQQAEEIRLLREKFIFHVAGELYEQGNQWTDAEAIANYKLSQVDAEIEAAEKAVVK